MRRILCLLLTLTAVTATAQVPKFRFIPGPKPGGGDIKVQVEEKNGILEVVRDEYMILEHEVRIEYQDIKVAADKMTVNLRTNDVVAEGHVVVDQGPTRVTATQAMYNLNSKTGTFFNATAVMDPSMFFAGDRIEKVDEDTFRLTNGVFTSCDLDRPAWSFHVGNADVTTNDYAYMKNISFRARGLPVFWMPRLIWPTKRDRSQGLLIPRARYLEEFGSRLEMGYFLPFGESVDATIFADVNFQEYFGAGVEVRYVPSENVKIGDFRAHVVNNAARDRIEWKYQYQHAQENLPGGFRGVIDVQDFSNLDFFREYDDDTRLHTLSNIYSSAYLTKNRPTYSLNILSDRRDIELLVPDPADTNPDDGTDFLTARSRFEQLPSLQLRMYPQRVGRTPVYFSMESSASHLRTGGVSPTGERRVDADYMRADIFPTVALQLRTPPWFSVKPQLSLRETYYSASLQCPFGEETCSTRQLSDEESISRFYAQGQIETVGPSFSRVFNKEMGGFSRFKHVIEPRVRYVYTTDVQNRDEILRFDTVDSPFLPLVQNSVEYSLTQRLIGKETGESGNARELLSFALRQSVALSEPFENTSSFTSGEHDFTPLIASLRFNPYQSVTLDASAAFGNISHQLDQVSVSANIVGTGTQSDKYVHFTYFASLDPPGTTDDIGTSQIRINVGSALVQERIRADVQLNFDAKEGRFLEQRYLAGWTGSCYGIALEFRRYELFGSQFEDSIRNSYGIAVTLKNVGTIGTH
jgi:LPS-assembly protein